MTTRTNPFASDPERAAVFELGYLAGFHDPAGDDSDFLPLAPELLDIYVEGADAGREDAHAPPAADTSKQWVSRSELREHSEDLDELREHVVTFGIFKVLEIITSKAIFGLLDLVITALGIQGNFSPEQLRPLEDDFTAPPGDPPAESVVFVAACSRTDHPRVTADVSPDGTWIGTPRKTFAEALQDAVRHGHREAWLARCDTQELTCSAVWIAKDRE